MTRVHTDLSRVSISVAPNPATSGTSLGVTDANAAYLPDTYPYWAVLVPTGAAPTRANSRIIKWWNNNFNNSSCSRYTSYHSSNSNYFI